MKQNVVDLLKRANKAFDQNVNNLVFEFNDFEGQIQFPSNPYTDDKTYSIDTSIIKIVVASTIKTCVAKIIDRLEDDKGDQDDFDMLNFLTGWYTRQNKISIIKSGFQPALPERNNNESEFYLKLSKGDTMDKCVIIEFSSFRFFIMKCITGADNIKAKLDLPFKIKSIDKVDPGRKYVSITLADNEMEQKTRESYNNVIDNFLRTFRYDGGTTNITYDIVENHIPLTYNVYKISLSRAYDFVRGMCACKLLGYMDAMDWDNIYGASDMLKRMSDEENQVIIRMIYMKADFKRGLIVSTIHLNGMDDIVLESGMTDEELSKDGNFLHEDYVSHFSRVIKECKDILEEDGITSINERGTEYEG